jgi:hypothetical protein
MNMEKLRELKLIIEAQKPGTPEFVGAVSEYNAVLELVMIGLREPLGTELEIDDDVILPDYAELRRLFREHGPYTIHDLVRDRDIIALVEVAKVGWRGEKVLLRPLEVYKGDAKWFRSKLTVPRSWMPDPWFTKGETVLVFAILESGTAIASGELSRLPLRVVDNEKWVCAIGQNHSFWSTLPTQIVESEVAAKWDSVRRLLITNQALDGRANNSINR